MRASQVMTQEVITASPTDLVGHTLDVMQQEQLRALPVVDDSGVVIGVFSTIQMLANLVPEYVSSGDLDQINFVPDLGILRKKYADISSRTVAEAMNTSPLLIHEDASVLSVAAELLSCHGSSLAWVINESKCLIGVVSAFDILRVLRRNKESNNA